MLQVLGTPAKGSFSQGGVFSDARVRPLFSSVEWDFQTSDSLAKSTTCSLILLLQVGRLLHVPLVVTGVCGL